MKIVICDVSLKFINKCAHMWLRLKIRLDDCNAVTVSTLLIQQMCNVNMLSVKAHQDR